MPKPIPNNAKLHPKFPFIACAPDGKIYSVKTGRARSLWKTKKGYLQLAIQRTSFLAHRLIADVFIKPIEGKPIVNHKNGIKNDNRSVNLEWCSYSENTRHARDVLKIRFGCVTGPGNPLRKFDKSHHLILKNLFGMGLTYLEISKIMGVSKQTISRHLHEITEGKCGHSDQVERDKISSDS